MSNTKLRKFHFKDKDVVLRFCEDLEYKTNFVEKKQAKHEVILDLRMMEKRRVPKIYASATEMAFFSGFCRQAKSTQSRKKGGKFPK